MPERPDLPPAQAVEAQRTVAKEILDNFLDEVEASLCLVVDLAGQVVVASSGHQEADATIVASLSASQFTANQRLASLVGDTEFTSLLHQGSSRSVFVAGLGGPALFVVVFREAPLASMTRVKTEEVMGRLRPSLRALMPTGFGRADHESGEDTDWARAMEKEIERVLGEGA